MNFLKLIRWQNLLIIAFTQYIIRHFIIAVILKNGSMELLFTDKQFFILVLSTVFIAAGGYIINDYFDSGIDAINKPGKLYVGKIITPNQALMLHTLLSLSGILMGLYLGIKVGVYKLALIQVITVGLLWFYSSEFKKQFLIGNLVVAFIMSLVPLLLVFYEMPLFVARFKSTVIENQEVFLLYKNIPLAMMSNISNIWYFVGGFSAFAFLLTLIREIIKDAEDYIGDEAFGCKTIPVKLGINTTKKIVFALIIITITVLGYLNYKQYVVSDYFSAGYMVLFVQIPLIILTILISRAQLKKQFSNASMFTKIIMISGLGYSFVFWWLMN